MIKAAVEDAINKQIVREMYSSNLYLAMAAYYQNLNLSGFTNWMRIQAQEETAHAMKFFDYLLERGGKAVIGQIEAPPTDWPSPLAVFEAAYEHEQKVTAWINELADIAMQEKDYATHILLQWFITEQVEEEANTNDIVERLKLIGESRSALFMIDNELKQRVFTPIPTTAP
jgi:ferritin